MNKKKIILTVLFLIVCGGGTTAYSIIQHNEKVHAQEIAQQKLEVQLKKEKDALKTAEIAVEIAYQSRETKDIELANQAIEKLSNNQSKDKETLTTKITKLNSFIKQIDELKTALTKAEKSKSDTDIKAVQKLLDSMTNDYLKEDKETAIKNLDNLKASIKEEKARLEAEKEVKEKAVAEVSAQQQIENETQFQEEQETPNQQSYNESPQQNYQQPAQTYQEPVPSSGGTASNEATQQENNHVNSNSPALYAPGNNGEINHDNGIYGNEAPNGHVMEPGGW
ncbi:hypothetical protein [Enterococcus plantarum]|uniref:hypothetical protein n=1 Tax=Enterococcus plantarum TaxID=1077675 RepID=UPI001A8E78C8|nr:hypothetical protein [Enterococcus plantarum]MBO0421379.1 hypothetical protein [Enterococcus plantarum]